MWKLWLLPKDRDRSTNALRYIPMEKEEAGREWVSECIQPFPWHNSNFCVDVSLCVMLGQFSGTTSEDSDNIIKANASSIHWIVWRLNVSCTTHYHYLRELSELSQSHTYIHFNCSGYGHQILGPEWILKFSPVEAKLIRIHQFEFQNHLQVFQRPHTIDTFVHPQAYSRVGIS